MTPLRLIGLIAATVTLTTLGMNVLADSAKRSDIVDAISIHSERPHKTTDERIKKLEVSNGVQASKLAKLEDVPEDVGAIKARVDLLIYAAQSTPQRERATKAAAQRVRREARKRGDDDPLAGMEGL